MVCTSFAFSPPIDNYQKDKDEQPTVNVLDITTPSFVISNVQDVMFSINTINVTSSVFVNANSHEVVIVKTEPITNLKPMPALAPFENLRSSHLMKDVPSITYINNLPDRYFCWDYRLQKIE